MQNPAMPNQRVCPNCGTPAQPGEQFCGNCGAALPPVTTQAGYQGSVPPQTGYPSSTPTQPGYQSGTPTQPGYQSGGPFTPPPYQSQTMTTQTQVKRSGSPMPLIIGGLVVVVAVVAVVLFLVLGSNKNNTVSNNTASNTTNSNTTNSNTTNSNTTNSNTTNSNTTNSNNSSGSSDNVSLLKQAAASMKSAKSYHIDVSGTTAGTQITMNGDVDVANNATNLSISSGATNVQLISVGSSAYVSTDGGSSFVDAGSSASSITSGMSEFTGMWNNFNSASVDASASSIKDGNPSTESIDGTSCKHMTASSQDLSALSAAGGSGNGTVDLWAATDGSSICQLKVATSDNTTNLIIKWSKLNSVPAITAPTNVTGGNLAGLGWGVA